MNKMDFATWAAMSLSLGIEVEARAMPGFARRYDPKPAAVFTFMPCSACHEIYPKLTPFGRQFKESGFRTDRETASWRDTLRFFPVALRSTAAREDLFSSTPARSSGTIKPIVTACLGSRISFWVDQLFRVDGDGFEYLGTDNAWVQWNDALRTVRPQLST